MILHRENPVGLNYTLVETSPNQTTIRLTGTQKSLVIDISVERISAMWYQWQMAGKFIQEAFKESSAEQREFLITGITPAEWNATFYNRVPNIEHCRNKSVCQETGKCESIRKYDRSCND